MDVLFLIARILFVFIFIMSGIGHLTQTEAMAGYAASRGVPGAKPMTLVTGVMIVVGGLMVLLGLWGDLGAILLLLFVVPTAFLMHGYWKETDPMAKQTEMVSFNKNLGLGGGALAFLYVFATTPELGLTLTSGLFA